MAGVTCCVYAVPAKPERIKLNELDLNETVNTLKEEVSRHTSIPVAELTVIFCGRVLNGLDTLESCGVQAGMTVHLIRKLEHLETLISQGMVKRLYVDSDRLFDRKSVEHFDTSEFGLQRFVLALKKAIQNPAYRSTIHRLTKTDVLEDIIAATPGLVGDPVAIAILQDPDLIAQFTDIATVHRVVESHPALIEAINHIVTAVHGESGHLEGSNLHPFPASYTYLLDALSDDDDIDNSQIDQPGSSGTSHTPSHTESSQSAFPAITPAQLASALAAVATAASVSTSALESADDSVPGTAAAQGAQSSVITSELFNQAMQQALSATTQSQLQQLRDMGITDDDVSLHVLQLTGGDVTAALELIFGDTHHDNQNSM